MEPRDGEKERWADWTTELCEVERIRGKSESEGVNKRIMKEKGDTSNQGKSLRLPKKERERVRERERESETERERGRGREAYTRFDELEREEMKTD